MKKTLIMLVGIVALSTVAFAQSGPGTTTTSIACNATGIKGGTTEGTCSVTGQTLLEAVVPEGLSINVPNEIDFTLIPGTLTGNPGNQPLTINTSWNLVAYDATNKDFVPTGYSNVYVDSWFASDVALSATDGSTNQILASDVWGQLGGGGTMTAFVANTPYITTGSTLAQAWNLTSVANVFPVDVYTVDSTTGVGSGTDVVNLFIDQRTNQAQPLASPTAVYKGYVYTTATAL